jgi:hypothetical protein
MKIYDSLIAGSGQRAWRIARIAPLLVAAAMILPSVVLAAGETGTFTATATVANSFTWTENTPLSFGSIVVVQDGTNLPTATLKSDGTLDFTQAGDENIIQTVAGAPGNYTVSTGIASALPVQIEFPGDTTLDNASNTNGTFLINTFQLLATSPSPGDFAGSTADLAACNTAINATTGGTCQFTTGNAVGNITFDLIANIQPSAVTDSFGDYVYTGSFDLVASYY